MRRNSPFRGLPSCSRGMRCERSPLATAPMTRATSSVGCTRSPIRVFSDSIRAAHEPEAAPRLALWVIRPSLPTIVAIRAVSRVPFSSSSATSLNASAIAAPTTVSSTGRRTLKSPLLSVLRAASSPFASKCPSGAGMTAVAPLPASGPATAGASPPAWGACLLAMRSSPVSNPIPQDRLSYSSLSRDSMDGDRAARPHGPARGPSPPLVARRPRPMKPPSPRSPAHPRRAHPPTCQAARRRTQAPRRLAIGGTSLAPPGNFALNPCIVTRRPPATPDSPGPRRGGPGIDRDRPYSTAPRTVNVRFPDRPSSRRGADGGRAPARHARNDPHIFLHIFS